MTAFTNGPGLARATSGRWGTSVLAATEYLRGQVLGRFRSSSDGGVLLHDQSLGAHAGMDNDACFGPAWAVRGRATRRPRVTPETRVAWGRSLGKAQAPTVMIDLSEGRGRGDTGGRARSAARRCLGRRAAQHGEKTCGEGGRRRPPAAPAGSLRNARPAKPSRGGLRARRARPGWGLPVSYNANPSC